MIEKSNVLLIITIHKDIKYYIIANATLNFSITKFFDCRRVSNCIATQRRTNEPSISDSKKTMVFQLSFRTLSIKLSTKLHAKYTKCFLSDDVMLLVIYEFNEGSEGMS